MRLRKVVLPFDEEEQIELLRIVMDSDEKAALSQIAFFPDDFA